MAPLERQGQEKYETLWDEIRRAGLRRGCASTASRTASTSRRRSTTAASTRSKSSSIASSSGRATRTRHRRRGRGGARPGQGRHARRPRRRRHATRPKWQVDRYSQHLACDSCGRSFEPLNPHHFSFNSPLGWCPVCEGLGVQHGANPALLDPRRPAERSAQGAVAAWPDARRRTRRSPA